MLLSLLAMEPRLEQDFALPVVASLAWLQVFDLFLGTQAMTMVSTKANRFSYADNPRWEIADRSALNMNEQHVFFLVLVWMHAVFVDAQLAGLLGLVAAGFRLAYPFLRMWTILAQELSTQPYWVCLKTLQANLLFKAFSGAPIVEYESLYTAGAAGKMLLIWLAMMASGLPLIAAAVGISKARLGGRSLAPGTSAPGVASAMEGKPKQA